MALGVLHFGVSIDPNTLIGRESIRIASHISMKLNEPIISCISTQYTAIPEQAEAFTSLALRASCPELLAKKVLAMGFPHFSRLWIKHHVSSPHNHRSTRQGPGSLDTVLGESHLHHNSNWSLYLASLHGRHSRGQHDGRQIQGRSQPS